MRVLQTAPRMLRDNIGNDNIIPVSCTVKASCQGVVTMIRLIKLQTLAGHNHDHHHPHSRLVFVVAVIVISIMWHQAFPIIILILFGSMVITIGSCFRSATYDDDSDCGLKLAVAAASRTIDVFASLIPGVIVVFALSKYRITFWCLYLSQ